jgi:hypothetical protein
MSTSCNLTREILSLFEKRAVKKIVSKRKGV